MKKLVWLLLFTCACIGEEAIQVQLPEDMGWFAIMQRDLSGNVVGLTPLEKIGGSVGLNERENRETILIAWTASELSALSPPEDRAVRFNDPLELAIGCATTLPSPSYAAALEDDRFTIDIARESLPALTARWARASCPADLDPTAYLYDVRCAFHYCEPVTTLDQCSLEVALEACDLGTFSGNVSLGGELCFRDAGARCTTVAQVPIAPAIARIECSDPTPCSIDVYDRRAAPNQPFDIELTRAKARTPYPHTAATTPVGEHDALHGHLSDLVVTAQAAYVTAHVGGSQRRDDCVTTAPTELERYHLETLELIDTSTLPSCVTRLLAIDDQLIAGHDEGTLVGFTRLDATGRILFSKAYDVGQFVPFGFATEAHVGGLALLGETVIALIGLGGPLASDHMLLALDAATLELEFQSAVLTGDPRSLIAIGERRVIVIEDSSDTSKVFRAESGTFEQLSAVKDDDTLGVASGEVLFVRDTERVYVSVHGTRGAMHVRGFDRAIARPKYYEYPGEVMSAAVWTQQPNRLLVSVSALIDGTRQTHLALLDTEHTRFLPGSWRVGDGIGIRMQPDPAGRFWMILPWSGELARITPR